MDYLGIRAALTSLLYSRMYATMTGLPREISIIGGVENDIAIGKCDLYLMRKNKLSSLTSLN